MISTVFCTTWAESQNEQQIVRSVDERLQLFPLMDLMDLPQNPLLPRQPSLSAEFQLNRCTDSGRSVGTEARAKAEQVSIIVPAYDRDFSSRKQAGVAEHRTRVFQKVSTGTKEQCPVCS